MESKFCIGTGSRYPTLPIVGLSLSFVLPNSSNHLFISFFFIYFHSVPLVIYCTFSEFGSVYLPLQIVPELLISFDALLQLLPEELHCCQLQLQSMETLSAAQTHRGVKSSNKLSYSEFLFFTFTIISTCPAPLQS